MGAPPDRIAAHDVFVSYASQDAAVANDVVGALERAGIICWIAPRDVIPGTFYADAIVHAIDASKAIVLLLSKHSVVSAHVLREVERGSSKRHPVVSLRTDQARMVAALAIAGFAAHRLWLSSHRASPTPAVVPSSTPGPAAPTIFSKAVCARPERGFA
jgi:TIR domain